MKIEKKWLFLAGVGALVLSQAAMATCDDVKRDKLIKMAINKPQVEETPAHARRIV